MCSRYWILNTYLSYPTRESDYRIPPTTHAHIAASLTMDVSNAIRQVEELLTLQESWYGNDGAIEIKTPALFSRLQRIGLNTSGLLEVKKTVSFDIRCSILYPNELSNLILVITFPLDYPSASTCQVQAVHASNPGEEYTSCTSGIANYLDAFSGCECVELVLDWLAEHKETCLQEPRESDDLSGALIEDDRKGQVQCYVLRYNHLLSGSEHKKEKAMLDDAKKSKLQGGLLWGTPGIVVIVPPSTEEDAREYASECRTIGKRVDGVDKIWLPQIGIDEAGLGGVAQQKRGGKMQELDTVGLRATCGGDEDLLRLVLGLR